MTVAQPPAPGKYPTNSAATAGLVLGIIALMVNTFLLVSLLGLVFSFVGYGRASGYEATTGNAVGRGKALAGIIIGFIALANSLTWKWLFGFIF